MWGLAPTCGEHPLQLSWSLYKNDHYNLAMPSHAKVKTKVWVTKGQWLPQAHSVIDPSSLMN